MQLFHLIDFLNSVAPPSFQENYDNAGLIVGDPNVEIKGVLVCLDAIESVIDEAIKMECNVVIAHHPIVFRGLKRFNGSNYVERTVIKAIKNDIAIFAIHTNLDNVFDSGVNAQIANILDLQNQQILAPKDNVFHGNQIVGAGMIGELPIAMEPMLFFNYLKEKMELHTFKYTEICKANIKRVAVCGGSGSFLLNHAKIQGADIFITSDYKYHEYFDADNDIIIADIGHFESEKFTIDLLYNLIINNFHTFATHCTKIVTNPIKYFQ